MPEASPAAAPTRASRGQSAREQSARVAVELHCANGLPDDHWGFTQDVVAEVALENDGKRLASGRTERSGARGSTPVWSGTAGSCLVFELAAGESEDVVVDVSALEVVVDLWYVSLSGQEMHVATARCYVSDTADGLPRDVRLKINGFLEAQSRQTFFESLLCRYPDATAARDPADATAVRDPADATAVREAPPDDDPDAPQLTLSVHCDSANGLAVVAYAPPSNLLDTVVEDKSDATPLDGTFTYVEAARVVEAPRPS